MNNFVCPLDFSLSDKAKTFLYDNIESLIEANDFLTTEVALNNLACITCNKEWFIKWENSPVAVEIKNKFGTIFKRMHFRVVAGRPMSIRASRTRANSLIYITSDQPVALFHYEYITNVDTAHSLAHVENYAKTEIEIFPEHSKIVISKEILLPHRFYVVNTGLPHRYSHALTGGIFPSGSHPIYILTCDNTVDLPFSPELFIER